MGMCGYGEESVLREIREGKVVINMSVLKRKVKLVGCIY